MAESNQPEAVRYPFGVIEVKQRDRGAPTRGNPLYPTAVEAKMAIPSLLPRVEEEDDFVRQAQLARDRQEPARYALGIRACVPQIFDGRGIRAKMTTVRDSLASSVRLPTPRATG